LTKARTSSREVLLKEIDDWTDEECHLDNVNAKALNTIFIAVGPEEYKLIYCKHISTRRAAKNAWDILQTMYEGMSTMRMLKLQTLTTQFEELRMSDHVIVPEFGSKLRDIANKVFQLRERYFKEKLVHKTLSSLPPQFHTKVAAIEECRDVLTIRLDDLMRSLQT
jgi:hypothetical protein